MTSFSGRDRQINHSISNRFFQCFSYIIDRVHQNSPSMHFRRANTDSGGPIRNRLCILGRPIRNRLCILRGPIRKQKQNVNMSKRVGKDGVFLGLAGLILRISLGLCPREIPRSLPASPRKTPSVPPLLLGLTQYWSSAWKSSDC